MAKVFGLADHYDIIEKVEDWDKPFFYYMIKCRLIGIKSGVVISEGMGSCNSKEDRYAWRKMFKDQLPDHCLVKSEKGMVPDPDLKTKRVFSKKTREYYTMYIVPNEQIFTQVNTIQKMAKKRALVDAALSAGRLSDLFTQDMEDQLTEYEAKKEEEAKKAEAKPKEKLKEEKPKEKPVEPKLEPEKKPEPEKKKEEPEPEESDDPLDNAAYSQEEEEIATSPSGKDQHDQVNKLLDTLEKTYNREAKDVVVKIHKVVSEKFQVVRKRIPEDLTMAEIYFVIERLNDTMVNEQKKRANAGGPL